jgi:uncharacterized membrane protein
MTTVSHEPALETRGQRPQWAEFLKIPEMWASIAISVMWLAVLFDAVYGASLVSTNAGTTTTIPSAVFVSFFAVIGSAAVAKRGFRRDTS